MKDSEFNTYINGMFNSIMKGKRVKIDKDKLNLLLKKQAKLPAVNKLEDISFGKVAERGSDNDRYWAFYLKNEAIRVGYFYFESMEYNASIVDYLAQKSKLDISKIASFQRMITGILVGYECKINDEMLQEYLLRRDFNRYLVHLKMHCDKKLYDEDVFITKFIRQTADTTENKEAVMDMEYGHVCRGEKIKWGLKLKNSELFISEFAQLYFSKEIYDMIIRDYDVKITYSCYLQICGLIYTILSGYDYIEML